jgi:N12 class adenine-specific DNA methylase
VPGVRHFAAGGISADELVSLSLNQKQALVKDRFKDEQGEHEVINPQKTAGARRAQQKVKEAFAKWARNHPRVGPHLEEIYKRTLNNLVEPQYDGAHLVFPGMNKSVLRDGRLSPHQSDAIWRIIQDGRALLAHVVGAGKTFEMIGAAHSGV